ncbi:MAG: hypothetical protein BLM47_00030 [Candidatus Reconcilbacillus cellulovorans]|uniref:Uncharacterized protein n=1 Tax=Candidatus Reconcilbacillus cellulovorans TaxID=1906605 RepID=A0A2A6E3H0_9BACL|nr:MAG: hypothetical protein BLM47_00030 [Candidatus Reconcilbacillus cellulovorans]
MPQIGRRIYFDKQTGNVIVDTGERSGAVIETTVEQDFETYRALAERVPETVDYIQLEYGQFAEDFRECSGYRVNPETREIEFSYPDPNQPEAPPVYQRPLSEQIARLEAELATAREERLAAMEAIAELYETLIGGGAS